MVRLKGIDTKEYYIAEKFQFHYGTIKRISKNLGGDRLGSFQFHYGTIKSVSKRTTSKPS